MKILLISNLYPPFVRGGAEVMVKKLALGFWKQGHDVSVISTKPAKDLEIKDERGIKVYRFKPINLFHLLEDQSHPYFFRFIWRVIDTFNLSSYFIVKSIIKKEKPDIVMTHNLVGIGLLIPLLIKKLGIFHIHTLHDVQLVEPSGLELLGLLYKENFFKKTYYKITRKLFEKVDMIISPSQFLLDYYSRYRFFPNSKKERIFNPASKYQEVDLSFADKSDDTKEKFCYLFVGQIEDHKGIEFLVRAFKEIENENIRLTILGTGSKIEDIADMAASDSRIIVKGQVENYEVLEHMKKCHFVIVPSLCYENSPTAIYESFMQGKPVIAANIGGIPELVADERGILFAPGDEDSLLDAIGKTMIMDNKEYEKMCYRCKEFTENLTIENYLNELINAVRKYF